MGLIDNNRPSFRDATFYSQKERVEKELGRKITRAEFIDNYYVPQGAESSMAQTGTSIFDPALCELNYLWFTKEGDKIIDPFAGGSVRGIVAAKMGRIYNGIDLRSEQIEANEKNAIEVCSELKPSWIVGDSKNILSIANDAYDFIFTCPPYGNLEVYSDDPADISNMPDDEFDATYNDIMLKTASLLKDDRFATVVVGNYRNRKGYMRDLVGITVRAFQSAGLEYYNDIIYVTPTGSLPVRAGRAFSATRKVGKTHQYVLNFVKGDPKKATERLGEIEVPDLSEYETEEEYV